MSLKYEPSSESLRTCDCTKAARDSTKAVGWLNGEVRDEIVVCKATDL